MMSRGENERVKMDTTLFGDMDKKIVTGAQFSDCREYRYVLWRTWDEGNGHVMFVGLNPSTADETKDDPTIRRCIGFAKRWGFGGIYMLNIFALRSTDPAKLYSDTEPIGPRNDEFLRMYADAAGKIVACWGNHGALNNRGLQVIDMLGMENLFCFKLTKNDNPGHPLYLSKDTEAVPLSRFMRE
jgi:hypothetical protein